MPLQTEDHVVLIFIVYCFCKGQFVLLSCTSLKEGTLLMGLVPCHPGGILRMAHHLSPMHKHKTPAAFLGR